MRSGRAIVLSDYIGGEGANSGGAGHAALDSYRALRATGADVRVVTGFGAAPAIEPDRFATLGGGDLRNGQPGGMLKGIYNPPARTALAHALADEDPDTTLVILHQWTRYLSPAALSVATRFPTMVYMHDYFWACPNGLYYDFQEERPCDRRPMGVRCLSAACDRQGRVTKIGRVARQAVRQAATNGPPARRLFLHLSEQAQRTAAPLLPGERHAILYNPLPMPEAAAPPPSEASHDVGYFGRLEADKGVGLLVDAVDELGLTGLFVGQGSVEPRFADSPGIDHRAWQPRDTMMAAMRSCRVVVLPSLWHETWGLIIPEAMAAGVPVLVSCRAGSAELVRRFGGGATFDPGIAGDLAAKLAAMLAVAPRPTPMRDSLRSFLSPERHAARILALAESQFGLDLRPAGRRINARATPSICLQA
ncbi:glycosyltransferase [Sphingomonas sp. PB2P19]|uniref:glycosyltransferase n=1 Tax=Sphingomonas rhamnosi TaxID=3096156 RepID=UPI002FC5E9B3